MCACAEGHIDSALALIATPVGTDGRYDGKSAIWCAVEKDLTDIVVALAEAGADVKQCRASDDNTLLHVAAEKGNAEMVSTLMACNASLTVKNKQDQLPIDVAANSSLGQTAHQ